jgi:hypothetical protein
MKIFISHIGEEKEIANALKEYLENKFSKRITVFCSSHEDNLKFGTEWFTTIKENIADCDFLIALTGPLSMKREWVNFECGAGWNKGVPVIPLCHSGIKPENLFFPLKALQGGVLSNRKDMQKLFKQIATQASLEVPICRDADFFAFIDKQEQTIRNSLSYKETLFINNILYTNIIFLKYSLFASYHDYDEMNELDIYSISLELTPEFNKLTNLFNIALLMSFSNKKVYDVVNEYVGFIIDDLKFILSSNAIYKAPSDLTDLFNDFLTYMHKHQNWYEYIKTIEQNVKKKELVGTSKRVIKNHQGELKYVRSNIINYFIDYHKTCLYLSNWINKYEVLTARLLGKQ